jgi:hypothetical protein
VLPLNTLEFSSDSLSMHTMASISHSSQQALLHLKKLKPYDSWSLETHRSTKEVRLLRRSIPLTDNYFFDVHYDTVSDNVVGILTKGPPAKGQILVDSSGKPFGKTPAIIYVTTWTSGAPRTRTTTRASSTTAEPPAPTSEAALSDQQNRELIKYAAYAIASAIAFRVFMSTFFSLYILAFPAVFLYAVQTVPSVESFEAKKELKRVMRGAHLPEDHVDKPKGWLNETLARVQASVTAELATGLGYEVSIMSMIGALHIATVNVPSVNRGFFWLGVFGKWRYVYSMELESNPQVST